MISLILNDKILSKYQSIDILFWDTYVKILEKEYVCIHDDILNYLTNEYKKGNRSQAIINNYGPSYRTYELNDNIILPIHVSGGYENEVGN